MNHDEELHELVVSGEAPQSLLRHLHRQGQPVLLEEGADGVVVRLLAVGAQRQVRVHGPPEVRRPPARRAEGEQLPAEGPLGLGAAGVRRGLRQANAGLLPEAGAVEQGPGHQRELLGPLRARHGLEPALQRPPPFGASSLVKEGLRQVQEHIGGRVRGARGLLEELGGLGLEAPSEEGLRHFTPGVGPVVGGRHVSSARPERPGQVARGQEQRGPWQIAPQRRPALDLEALDEPKGQVLPAAADQVVDDLGRRVRRVVG